MSRNPGSRTCPLESCQATERTATALENHVWSHFFRRVCGCGAVRFTSGQMFEHHSRTSKPEDPHSRPRCWHNKEKMYTVCIRSWDKFRQETSLPVPQEWPRAIYDPPRFGTTRTPGEPTATSGTKPTLKKLTVPLRRISNKPETSSAVAVSASTTSQRTAVAAATPQMNKEVRRTVIATVQSKPVGAVQPSPVRPDPPLGPGPIKMTPLDQLLPSPEQDSSVLIHEIKQSLESVHQEIALADLIHNEIETAMGKVAEYMAEERKVRRRAAGQVKEIQKKVQQLDNKQ